MSGDIPMTADAVIIGAGNVGIAVAYHLATVHGLTDVVIIDSRDPMSLTSAQSGENYRNWWPHPVMTAFTDHSIDLLERIASETDNRIAMTRRGYALATRQPFTAAMMADLRNGYGPASDGAIRVHEAGSSRPYVPPAAAAAWDGAPSGVDVLCDAALIRRTFPTLAPDVQTVLHVRRAGSISGQQLGQYMLEAVREAGGRVLRGHLAAVEGAAPFDLRVATAAGGVRVRTERFVNAAGPFFSDVAAMLGEDLPLSCVYQQKIAFEDRLGAIARDMPFVIDLDGQELDWSEEDRAVLAEDPASARLLQPLPGGIHCRPDGAFDGKWIKLGWAYNARASDPHGEAPIDPQFPDIVLRGASRLHPALAAYLGRLPRGAHHYGGYYPMTPENWPLIGPMRTPGAFMAGALSGFGTMAACATGALCAAWAAGGTLPSYAPSLGLARYGDHALMADLAALNSRGVL